MEEAPLLKSATWTDLTSEQNPDLMTPIERADRHHLSELQQHWVDHGWVVLPKFMPDDLIDGYLKLRESLPKDASAKDNYLQGWSDPVPHVDYPELRDIATYPMLQRALFELIGLPCGLHLCLTGFVSTERLYHQDWYLNDSYVTSHYAGVWTALDNISADAGPFHFIDGSHKWPVLQKSKLFKLMPEAWRSDDRWPSLSQEDVSRVCEEEIKRRGAKVSEFIPERGDTLIWHSALVHKGSAPKNRNLLRKALITHYSSICHRPDFKRMSMHTNGSRYFDFDRGGCVR